MKTVLIKPILFILLSLLTIPLIGQESALEMSKSGTEKSILFKENKRVKVKTLDGEKYIGRFQILDADTIEIEGNIIPLSSISNIKNRSIAAGIAGTILIVAGIATIIYGNTVMFLTVVTLGLVSPTFGVVVTVFGFAITAAGIFFNEFAENHRSNKWTYKIVKK